MERVFIFILMAISLPLLSNSQNKAKVSFKEGDTLRLNSNSKQYQDTSVTIIVPRDKDTTNKSDIPMQDSIKGGKILIELDKENSTVALSKVKLSSINEFTLDSLKEKHEFVYSFTLPRDQRDDKVLVLKMHVKNKAGQEIAGLLKTIRIYVKPLTADTLGSDRLYELWFLTGTNFDLFDGVKAQEFFFRANSLFRISDKFFGQIAFYKNRYFSIDTSSGTLPFSSVKKPIVGDSIYTITEGNYRKIVNQRSDPLGLQLDILYKLTNNSESNFFVTGGFDFSTISVSINNKYEYLDTTFHIQTSKPDTVRNYNSLGTTAFPESISYQKPNYDLNIGLMWILNENEVNIKAHFTVGSSTYANLISYYQSKGSGVIYNLETKKKVYLQMRMYATYKPLGLTFGLESFIRQTSVPAFNFTLSKAFDIKGFVKNLTPVSGLKMSNN